VTLPFAFDTSAPVRTILTGVLGLFALALAGLLYSLVVSRDSGAMAAMGLVAVIVAGFGTIFARTLDATTGTITADAVTVRPARLSGIPLAGPSGSFAIDRFTSVRVDRIVNPVENYGHWHERVTLAGRPGTPDVLVARTREGEGRVLGHELAAALRLPVEERLAPH
jgi:hypothetical protein